MSDGRTHAKANTIVLGVTVLCAFPALPFPLALGATVGAFAGLILTPDIDLCGVITHEERRMLRWFGPLGGMWVAFWYSYARTHSHRGSSHAPFVGTWGRWAYVGKRLWPLMAIALYFYGGFVLAHLFVCFSVLFFTFVFNCAQDVVHLILDGWKFHPGR